MKKQVLMILGIVIVVLLVIFLIGYSNFQSEKTKFSEKWGVVSEGITLIHEGKYNEGLDKCNEFTYYNTYLCHAAVVLTKKERGEPISLEFCQSIPTELNENYPFTIKLFRLFENPNAAEDFKKSSLDIVEQCKQAVSPT